MAQERDIYSAMQEGEPLARYKKTILGKVHIVALNPFTEEPEGVILEGVPNDPAYGVTAVMELWSPKQLVFFERMNDKHIQAGRLVKMDKPLPKVAPSPNIISDEEIDTLLNSKFLVLKNRLVKFTGVAPIFRVLNRARELNKSEKIIKHIEERLSQLQLAEYGVEKPEEETK